jgi:signal transduction histidine kinase
MFSFFSLFYFPAQQEKILKKNFDNEAQNLAKTIALGVRIAYTTENFEGIKTAMSFVKDDQRLIYVKLIQTDTLWEQDSNRYQLNDTVLNTFPEDTVSSLHTHSVRDSIIKTAPIQSEVFSGKIELSFSTESIIKGKKVIRTTSLIVSAVVFIIGILIGFWLARNISVPVLALRNAADKVGEGDLTQRVYNDSGDEIGDLSRSFNKMVNDLAKARAELHKANAELASTNEALHKTVADLKATQDQLIQSEKMASLGQLTAGIAHEINNPVNFVTSSIQPLKDDLADVLKIISRYEKVVHEKGMENDFQEVEHFRKESNIEETMKEVNHLLKGIEEGALRTSEIVKGLRNFSRLDQTVYRKSNLNESIESTLTLLHNSFKNRIEIIKEYSELPEIDCFPGQINQVLMNILSNAIQAIPAEGSIFIKTWRDKEWVKISIRDTGIGMTDEVRKKIFDPFFTTKEVGKGTGLGLSISYGIIQKHNGRIEVISAPGKGTEFLISIPINQKSTS